ncbi:twin-arginine translocation signal domain-containing protein, partial [Acinetobacter baumannii]
MQRRDFLKGLTAAMLTGLAASSAYAQFVEPF